jgi:hypothetical protein
MALKKFAVFGQCPRCNASAGAIAILDFEDGHVKKGLWKRVWPTQKEAI